MTFVTRRLGAELKPKRPSGNYCHLTGSSDGRVHEEKAVHRTPDLDPSVVEKILARHEGELSDPVVYRDDRPLESKGSATRPPI